MLEVTSFKVVEGAGSLVELAECNGGWALGESFTQNGEMKFRIKSLFNNYPDARAAYDHRQGIVTDYFIKNGAAR